MLAQCPWCRSRFEAKRTGRQNCPICGAEIDLPEPEGQAPSPRPELPPWEQTSTHWEGWEHESLDMLPPSEAVKPSEAPPAAAPWERMGEIGVWPAFSQTWVGASLHPSRFFGGLGSHPSIWPAFGFAFLVLGVASIFSTLFTELWIRSSGMPPGFTIPALDERIELGGLEFEWLIPGLIFSAMGVFLYAAIVHFGCWIVGAANREFSTTFRTLAYAHAPALLGVVPGVDFLVYVWVFAVAIVGIRHTQGTTTGRAAFAVLLPFVALGALVILGVLVTAIFLLA